MGDPIKEYQFPVIKSITDSRDYKASKLLAASSTPILTSSDLEDEMWITDRENITILDQGTSSACTGYTGEKFVRIAQYYETGELVEYSPSYIYADRGDDDYQGEGDYMRNMLKQLKADGTCLKSEFYMIDTIENMIAAFDELSDDIKTSAKENRIKSYYSVDETDSEEITTLLTKYKLPVLFSIPVYPSFADSYEDGIIPLPDEDTETLVGGHAIPIVGYKFIDEKLHYIIANSWGKKYGDEGFFYIPYDYPFYEAWIAFDYKKIKLEIPMGEDSEDNENAIAYLNGLPITMYGAAYFKDDRTMVSARTLSEVFDMDIEWHQNDSSVEISEYLNAVWFKLNSNEVINSYTLNTVDMDVEPDLDEDANRVFIPVRYLVEMLGYNIEYDDEYDMTIVTNY